MTLRDSDLATLWVPATNFVTGTGSPPATTVASRIPAWALDAATPENVRGSMCIPPGWVTARIDIVFSNAGAGSGDVKLQVDGGRLVDGIALADDFTLSVTATAPVNGTPEMANLATGQAVTPGPYHVRCQRAAADAADTLANDCTFIGLLLTRTA